MHFAPFALGLLVLTTGALAVQAQDVADEREATMKAIGRSYGLVNRMNRGQASFDAAQAREAFTTIATNAERFSTLFADPATADDEALPAIWENKADFDAKLAKLRADATSAAAAGTEDAFKTAFAPVAENCGACHKLYRGKD